MYQFIKSKKIFVLIFFIVIVLMFIAINVLGITKVEAYRVKQQKATKGVTVTGTVKAPNDVGIQSSVTAKIEKILVSKGDYVKAGQVLAVLDRTEALGNLESAKGTLYASKAQLRNLQTEPRIQQANIARDQIQENQYKISTLKYDLAKLRVQLKDAESAEQRNLNLYKEGAVSFRDYEVTLNSREELQSSVEGVSNQIKSAKAKLNQSQQNLSLILAGTKSDQIRAAQGQVASAQGNVNALKGKLDNYTIRAPFSGYVAQKILDVGQDATSSNSILRLIKPENLYINALIEENQLNEIKLNQESFIVFDAYPAQLFKGKVYLLSKNVDPVTGTFEARIKIPIVKNKPIVVGMTSDVTIITKKLDKALIVPSAFVSTKNKKKYVFIQRNDKAVQVYISGTNFSNSKFVVTSGLKDGDIILKPLLNKKLKDGSRVKVESFIKS